MTPTIRCSLCHGTAHVIVGDGPPVCLRCIQDAVACAEGDVILRKLLR